MKENQAVEFLAIDQIAPYPRNPRTHPEANVAKLVASIKEFGWTTPILVDEENAVLAGHGRLLAARALLMPQVPCLRIPGLSSAQKRAYRLADNRLTLDSDWDLEMLQLELQELGEFDLALTGFDEKELDDILGLNGPQEGEDDTPELQETAVSKLGDIWALGPHRLLCGDATDKAQAQRLLQGQNPAILIADPPYGMHLDTSYANSVDNLAKGICKSRGYPPVFGDDHPFDPSPILHFCAQIDEHFWWGADYYHAYLPPGGSWLVWDKRSSVEEVEYSSSEFELCWSRTPHHRIILRVPWFGVIGTEQQDTAKRLHPTQKPLQLIKSLLEEYSEPGAVCYDPFMGSGTTIIAAETTARVAYGVEINPLYVDIAIRRWQTFTGKTATRLEDGKAFDG